MQSELWYMGGFFDGEGTASLICRTRGGNPIHTLIASVCNHHKGVCDMFQRHFGGVIAHAHVWRWQATNSKAAAALAVLRPYTIIKTPQIDVCLDWRNDTLNSTKGSWRVDRARQDHLLAAKAARTAQAIAQLQALRDELKHTGENK